MQGARGRGPARVTGSADDPARTPFFRGLLLVQMIAATIFGLVPFVAAGEFARLFQLRGDEPYIYRLAGAASAGYAVAAALGLLRPRWIELRIPLVATVAFLLATFTAALLSIEEAGVQPLSALVLLVSVLFIPVSGWWLVRHWARAETEPHGANLEPGFRITLALATLAAAVFGVLPVLLPRTLLSFLGLAESDLVVLRLGGAGCFGYAVAGVLQIRADAWPAIRVQNAAAITFNALSAIASAIYLAGGGRSPLGFLVLGAGMFFAIAMTWWAVRAGR